MNLEKLDFVELTEQEKREIDGGITFLGVACAVLAVTYLASTCHALANGRKLNGMP